MEIKLTTGTNYRKGLLQFVQPYPKLRDIAISGCWALNAGVQMNYIEAEQAKSRWAQNKKVSF